MEPIFFFFVILTSVFKSILNIESPLSKMKSFTFNLNLFLAIIPKRSHTPIAPFLFTLDLKG